MATSADHDGYEPTGKNEFAPQKPRRDVYRLLIDELYQIRPVNKVKETGSACNVIVRGHQFAVFISGERTRRSISTKVGSATWVYMSASADHDGYEPTGK